MVGDNNIDDDEYVANLLKQDAQKSTKQYKMVGLDAFVPGRSRSGAPKPNTRFLRHIIRETDSHNSALLAKEAQESRARLRHMSREKERDIRKRDVGRLTPPKATDDEREHRKRKRTRYDDSPDDRGDRRRRERGDNDNRESGRVRDRHREGARRKEKSRREYSDDEESARGRFARRRESPDERHRNQDRRGALHKESRREENSRPKHHRSHRARSRSSNRSLSPPRKHHRSSRHSHRSRSRPRTPEHERRPAGSRHKDNSREPESDSDPLEDIVGPLPPPSAPVVRARGRGADKANSTAMDTRFSTAYNPSADVQLQSDVDDDWGDALEALKDRQRWKQQGADRLRAAGFSDEQVKRWEKGDEKTEEDVRWALKGEAREWDRGKVVDDDGHVNLKAGWGRLT